MSEQSAELRTANKLGTHPDQISHVRDAFYASQEGAFVRELLLTRIEMFVNEHAGKLRKVKPDDLRYIQGVIDGLELAASQIKAPTTS